MNDQTQAPLEGDPLIPLCPILGTIPPDPLSLDPRDDGVSVTITHNRRIQAKQRRETLRPRCVDLRARNPILRARFFLCGRYVGCMTGDVRFETSIALLFRPDDARPDISARRSPANSPGRPASSGIRISTPIGP